MQQIYYLVDLICRSQNFFWIVGHVGRCHWQGQVLVRAAARKSVALPAAAASISNKPEALGSTFTYKFEHGG